MPTTASRTLSVLAAAAAIGLASSACGGAASAPPTTLPAVHATAGPTPVAGQSSWARVSPTPAARVAATDVVRAYFRASNRLRDHMNPNPLSRLFSAACPCRAQVASIRTARAHGDRFAGRATINVLRPTVTGRRTASVLADYDFSRGGLLDATGRRLTSTPARHHLRWLFLLRDTGGRWQIERIEQLR